MPQLQEDIPSDEDDFTTSEAFTASYSDDESLFSTALRHRLLQQVLLEKHPDFHNQMDQQIEKGIYRVDEPENKHKYFQQSAQPSGWEAPASPSILKPTTIEPEPVKRLSNPPSAEKEKEMTPIVEQNECNPPNLPITEITGKETGPCIQNLNVQQKPTQSASFPSSMPAQKVSFKLPDSYVETPPNVSDLEDQSSDATETGADVSELRSFAEELNIAHESSDDAEQFGCLERVNGPVYSVPEVKMPVYEIPEMKLPVNDTGELKMSSHNSFEVISPMHEANMSASDSAKVKVQVSDTPEVKITSNEINEMKLPVRDIVEVSRPAPDTAEQKIIVRDLSKGEYQENDANEVTMSTPDIPEVKMPLHDSSDADMRANDVNTAKSPSHDSLVGKISLLNCEINISASHVPEVKTSYNTDAVEMSENDSPEVKMSVNDMPEVDVPRNDTEKLQMTFDVPAGKMEVCEQIEVMTVKPEYDSKNKKFTGCVSTYHNSENIIIDPNLLTSTNDTEISVDDAPQLNISTFADSKTEKEPNEMKRFEMGSMSDPSVINSPEFCNIANNRSHEIEIVCKNNAAAYVLSDDAVNINLLNEIQQENNFDTNHSYPNNFSDINDFQLKINENMNDNIDSNFVIRRDIECKISDKNERNMRNEIISDSTVPPVPVVDSLDPNDNNKPTYIPMKLEKMTQIDIADYYKSEAFNEDDSECSEAVQMAIGTQTSFALEAPRMLKKKALEISTQTDDCAMSVMGLNTSWCIDEDGVRSRQISTIPKIRDITLDVFLPSETQALVTQGQLNNYASRDLEVDTSECSAAPCVITSQISLNIIGLEQIDTANSKPSILFQSEAPKETVTYVTKKINTNPIETPSEVVKLQSLTGAISKKTSTTSMPVNTISDPDEDIAMINNVPDRDESSFSYPMPEFTSSSYFTDEFSTLQNPNRNIVLMNSISTDETDSIYNEFERPMCPIPPSIMANTDTMSTDNNYSIDYSCEEHNNIPVTPDSAITASWIPESTSNDTDHLFTNNAINQNSTTPLDSIEFPDSAQLNSYYETDFAHVGSFSNNYDNDFMEPMYFACSVTYTPSTSVPQTPEQESEIIFVCDPELMALADATLDDDQTISVPPSTLPTALMEENRCTSESPQTVRKKTCLLKLSYFFP